MNVSEYFEQPHINLTGAVDAKMLEDLDRQVRMIEPNTDKSVMVTLTSPGGGVGYARAIYEELGLLQEEQANLSFVARGICMSAAVTIAMAFPVERRFATSRAKFLIHEGSRNVNSELVGTVSERKMQLGRLMADFEDDVKEEEWVMGVISKGCKQRLREVKKQARSGLYLKGQEAVKWGLVSGLVSKTS